MKTTALKTNAFQIHLTEAEARDFALFLRRIGFSDYRQNAFNTEEAYRMRNAGDRVRCALASPGYRPR